MKVTFKTADDRLAVEFEGDDQKAIFQELALFQEVFASATACGACGERDVRFVVRNNQGNNFYELWCTNKNCRCKLSFGVKREGGTLFPHRKDKAGNWLDNGGWVRYEGKPSGDTF